MKPFVLSLSKLEWLQSHRPALKKQLFMVIFSMGCKIKNGQTVTIKSKPLPASPCQGRSCIGSPPDKGELEGIWVLENILFPARALPRVCGAYLAQAERDVISIRAESIMLDWRIPPSPQMRYQYVRQNISPRTFKW